MTLERRILNIAVFTAVLLTLVSLRIVYWQLFRGDDLQPNMNSMADLKDLPQPVIQRSVDLLGSITRGAIYDRSGRLLADDRISPEGDRFRFYSEPSLAHVIGYVSGLRTGVTGIEYQYNQTLLGLDRPDTMIDQTLNRSIQGSDLILTIDSTVQRAAENALDGRAGSIVVLDAHTGAVLAMANAPRFDPNRILEPAYVAGLLEQCNGSPGCQAPFLNRATQALYPPGSTWKTVSLAAALDSGQVGPDAWFDFGEPVQGPEGTYFAYSVDGGVIPDANHKERQLSLEMSYAMSANAAFARIGDEMAAETMIDYARRFGYGSPGEISYPLDFDYTPAQLAQNVDNLYENNWLRAVTAIGQGELLTSPLNVGIMVMAVLNEGDVPVPYLVQAVREPSGREYDDLPNRHTLTDLIRPETAQLVRQMMVSVVEKGSGQKAKISGLTVGGKTGTAQVGGEVAPHSWFAGFAQNDRRGVVVVVIIENGGQGSQTAASTFATVVRAAMEAEGEAVETSDPAPGSAPAEAPDAIETPEIPEGQVNTPLPEPTVSSPTLVPTPASSGDQDVGTTPPPDIPRDSSKNDITAANPSCAILRDIPEATGEFIWPSSYQALSGGDFREGHPGLDLSAPNGSPVYASDTGLVFFSGWSGMGYGNAILIDHGNGYQTLYAHLSQVSQYCGAEVEKGKMIGQSGNTGNSTGPHLHFEVRVPGGYLNPISVLPVP